MFAVSNGLNPTFGGIVTAQGFVSSLGIAGTSAVAQTIILKTNGTTPVNVFGALNGFSGSFTSFSVIAIGGTAANITLKTGVAGVSTTVAVIAKGATAGAIIGSGIAASAFVASGTATIESSVAGTDAAGGGNAQVELNFTS